MNKLTDIADCLKVLDSPKDYTTATYCMAEDELQSYGAEWLKYLISLLEEKDKALQEVEDYLHIISGLKERPSSVESYVDLAIETINKVRITSSNNEGES